MVREIRALYGQLWDGSSGAVEYANAELNRYREARAVWDARGERVMTTRGKP